MIAPPRVGRDGALRLCFERRGAATVLAGCRSVPPLQVLVPLALDDPAAVVSVLNPTGGVLGGDRLAIDVEIGADAHACLTTPSATRVYRSAGEPAVQAVRLALGPRAIAEWVPDHTIPSEGAALRQSIEVDVGDGATLFLVDAFAAGRVARGEAWRFALLDSALTVRDAAGLILHERFVLGPSDTWSGLGFAESRPYWATLLVVSDSGVDAFAAGLPGAVAALAGASAGAAALPRRGVLVRCLAASAPVLTDALDAIWVLARRTVIGAPPLRLRKA